MKKALILTAAVLLLGSCATVINGRKQELSFDSNEKDTQIFIGDKEVCRTPVSSKLPAAEANCWYGRKNRI